MTESKAMRKEITCEKVGSGLSEQPTGKSVEELGIKCVTPKGTPNIQQTSTPSQDCPAKEKAMKYAKKHIVFLDNEEEDMEIVLDIAIAEKEREKQEQAKEHLEDTERLYKMLQEAFHNKIGLDVAIFELIKIQNRWKGKLGVDGVKEK